MGLAVRRPGGDRAFKLRRRSRRALCGKPRRAAPGPYFSKLDRTCRQTRGRRSSVVCRPLAGERLGHSFTDFRQATIPSSTTDRRLRLLRPGVVTRVVVGAAYKRRWSRAPHALSLSCRFLEVGHECSASMAARWRLVRHLQLRHPLPLRIRTAADRQSLPGRARLARARGSVWRREAGRTDAGGARRVRRQSLGRRGKGRDGHVHRRKGERAAARSPAGDLRRPGRRLAGGLCGQYRRDAWHGVRADHFRGRGRPRHIGGSRFPAASSGARKRFPVRPHRPASGCRRSTRRARRSARARLPPGGVPSR